MTIPKQVPTKESKPTAGAKSKTSAKDTTLKVTTLQEVPKLATPVQTQPVVESKKQQDPTPEEKEAARIERARLWRLGYKVG